MKEDKEETLLSCTKKLNFVNTYKLLFQKKKRKKQQQQQQKIKLIIINSNEFFN